jgi:prepilin-type N-terminal cleavage/methylation domain-containing protein
MTSEDAFTLLELLVVMAIIVALVAVSLPALRGLNQSNTVSSATRQLLDDLAWARQKAITDRSTVHVVFVPPSIATMTFKSGNFRDERRDALAGRQLRGEAYSAYGFFAERTAGDQPGQGKPRYLRQWSSLPDGILFAKWEFPTALQAPDLPEMPPAGDQPLRTRTLPFPTIAGFDREVPHVAFDSLGRLLNFSDEVITLARASVFPERDPTGDIIDYGYREAPPGNSRDPGLRVQIRIDGLTGRARVEQPQIVP